MFEGVGNREVSGMKANDRGPWMLMLGVLETACCIASFFGEVT